MFRYAALSLLACSVFSVQHAAVQEIGPAGTKSGYARAAYGIKIHYFEGKPAAAPQSPAMLFVPGWTMPADVWEYQIAHFSKSRRVVAMEPRSYGLSSQAANGNSAEGHARDIKLVLDQLKLKPVVLVVDRSPSRLH